MNAAERQTSPPGVPPTLLRDLHALAVRHLGTAAGQTALAVAGLDHPDIVAAYRPGFLPAELHELLPTTAQAAIAGRDIAGKLVLPAFDERGVVVDLCAVGGPASLWDKPRGLLAPVLVTACADVATTDDPAQIGPGFQAGRPTRLVRAGEQQSPKVPRTVDAAPSLTLVRHEARAERATFTAGPLTIDAQVPHRGRSKLDISITANGSTERQTIDLSVVTQRLRFARTAGLKLRVPAGTIASTLEALWPALRALAEPAAAPARLLPVDDVPAILRDQALLDRFLADCARLGWTGDHRAVVLLSAISRLSFDPVWTVLTSTAPGERFPALDVLLRITPPEAIVHASRLTDNALAHLDPGALRHKLLIIDEATAIAPAVATALGILRARGSLTGTEVQRDGIAGRMRTQARTIPGPLAVITATTATIPPSLRRHLLEVPADDGSDHAAALFAARQQRLSTLPADPADIIARLHTAQRALQPLPVILPDLGEVPAEIRQHRSLHDSFFGLVTASALLHQFQRSRCDGHIAASAADVALAVRLLSPLVPVQIDGLPLRARQLQSAIRAAGVSIFAVADLSRWLPEWSPATRWRAVADLIEADLVQPVAGRQGARRSYRWLGPTPLPLPTGGTEQGVACG